MAKKGKFPTTAATRVLDGAKAAYEKHLYAYEERGGTAVSSRELGVDEATVVKTLVFETDEKSPLIVLMPGVSEVSTKNLARHLGVKGTAPCRPDVAQKHSGYQTGGTSPFGLRKAMPIYAEAAIRDVPVLYINGGKRGFLVSLAPSVLEDVLSVEWVQVAQA